MPGHALMPASMQATPAPHASLSCKDATRGVVAALRPYMCIHASSARLARCLLAEQSRVLELMPRSCQRWGRAGSQGLTLTSMHELSTYAPISKRKMVCWRSHTNADQMSTRRPKRASSARTVRPSLQTPLCAHAWATDNVAALPASAHHVPAEPRQSPSFSAPLRMLLLLHCWGTRQRWAQCTLEALGPI